jgi:hypothetical protein
MCLAAAAACSADAAALYAPPGLDDPDTSAISLLLILAAMLATAASIGFAAGTWRAHATAHGVARHSDTPPEPPPKLRRLHTAPPRRTITPLFATAAPAPAAAAAARPTAASAATSPR